MTSLDSAPSAPGPVEGPGGHRVSVLVLVISVLVALTTLILGFASFVAYRTESLTRRQHLEQTLAATADHMAASLTLPVWNFDRPQTARILDSLMADRVVQEVNLRSGSGAVEVLTRSRGPNWTVETSDRSPAWGQDPGPGLMATERPITLDQETLGHLRLVYSTRFLDAELRALLRQRLAWVAALDLLLIACMSLLLWHLVLHPLRDLQRLAERVSSGEAGDFLPATANHPGELGALQAALLRTFGLLRDRYQALQLSEERFRVLVDQAPEAIIVADADERVVVDANQKAAALLDIPREQLIGRSIFEIYKADQPDGQPVDRTMRDNIGEALRGKVVVFERAIRSAGGELRRCEVHLVRLPSKDRRLVRATYLDITERKRSEDMLRKLSQVVEQSPISILITNMHGHIEYVNPVFLKTTGYAPEEILGETIWLFQMPGLSAEQDAEFWDRITQGKVWQGEMTGTRKDGGTLYESVHISPVFDERGEPTHLICMKENITERHAAEEERRNLEGQLFQSQKLEALGLLAGGIAHDMNNMLGAVMGHTDMLRVKLPATPDLERHLNGIATAADRSRDIVQKVLAFSRKQVFSPRPLDLNAHITATRDTLAPLIGEDIQFTFWPGPDLWPILADPSQIDQVVMNLVVNARDAMPAGGTLSVETENRHLEPSDCEDCPQSAPGDYVAVRVRDSGVGMDEATLARIFEPFFTTKPVGVGTGLGLSTLFGIVKQNNGFVTVESVPGKGTCFEVFLPRLKAEAVPAAEAPPPAAPPKKAEGTILIVEDDVLLGTVISALAESLGYRTLTANSPEEALELAADLGTPLDLLLTDVVMPGMNGRELRVQIERLRPGLPTLFMSGYTADVIAKRGILEEGVHLIRKPFSKHELIQKLQDLGLGTPTPQP
ncbi:MAG TPA: PAS domain S-box protein [Holophagaceae bacterium]|nr:PAS domain S-box protein [Holophagaceae bacterium]